MDACGKNRWGKHAASAVAYVEQEFGIVPDNPFSDFESMVMRHPASGKWFALIMRVTADKLGLHERQQESIEIQNVKCEPALLGSFRNKEGIHPAYHMNKDHWLTIRLDGSVSDADVCEMIGMSYNMTRPKGKKRGNTDDK